MSATDQERVVMRPIPLVPRLIFANADNYSEKVLIAQTVIHITFLLSTMAVAATDRLMVGSGRAAREHV